MTRSRAIDLAARVGLVLAVAAACALPSALAYAQDEASEAEPEPSFHAQLGVGLGIGLRDIRVPSVAGERTVQTGLFPALDLDLRAAQRLSPRALLGARLRYQSSLGMVGRETPYAGVERETPMRSHHVEAGLEAMLRFTSAPDSVALGAFAGWSIRGLRTESELSVPDYSVHGPVARLLLVAPLRGQDLVLRLEPELIVWVVASGAIHEMGVLDTTGLAYGGHASLHIGLVEGLGLELTYRGSFGAIASGLGGSLTDTEHFATLQLVLVY